LGKIDRYGIYIALIRRYRRISGAIETNSQVTPIAVAAQIARFILSPRLSNWKLPNLGPTSL